MVISGHQWSDDVQIGEQHRAANREEVDEDLELEPGGGVVVCRAGPGETSGHQRSSVVISGHPRSSAAIRGHQKSSVVISVHYDDPGDKLLGVVVIRGHQRPSVVISVHYDEPGDKFLGVVVDILADEPCLSSIVKGNDHRVRDVRGLDAVDVQLEQLEGRQSMAINGNQWQSMAINGNQWQSMGRSVALNSHSVHAHIIITSLAHH